MCRALPFLWADIATWRCCERSSLFLCSAEITLGFMTNMVLGESGKWYLSSKILSESISFFLNRSGAKDSASPPSWRLWCPGGFAKVRVCSWTQSAGERENLRFEFITGWFFFSIGGWRAQWNNNTEGIWKKKQGIGIKYTLKQYESAQRTITRNAALLTSSG